MSKKIILVLAVMFMVVSSTVSAQLSPLPYHYGGDDTNASYTIGADAEVKEDTCLYVSFKVSESGYPGVFRVFVYRDGKSYSYDLSEYAQRNGTMSTYAPVRLMKEDKDTSSDTQHTERAVFVPGDGNIKGYGIWLQKGDESLNFDLLELYLFDCKSNTLDLLRFDGVHLSGLYPNLCTFKSEISPVTVDEKRYIDFSSEKNLTKKDIVRVLFVQTGAVSVVIGKWDGHYGKINRFAIDPQVEDLYDWENPDHWILKTSC